MVWLLNSKLEELWSLVAMIATRLRLVASVPIMMTTAPVMILLSSILDDGTFTGPPLGLCA